MNSYRSVTVVSLMFFLKFKIIRWSLRLGEQNVYTFTLNIGFIFVTIFHKDVDDTQSE